MKNFLFSLALVATVFTFISCKDDEPYDPVITHEEINATGLISSTITIADNSVNYIESANYTFRITSVDNKKVTVGVLANGVKFDSHMPYAVTFAMEGIGTTTFDSNTISFSASSVRYFDPATGEENTRYKLTNVNGYIDKKNGVYSLVYTVNDTWRVQVTSPTMRSYVADNDYSAPTETYYTYKIDIATMKAEVFLHNVQFKVGGASSPVLKKISIPDLDVTPTAEGFELSGDNIVPFNYSGANLDQATPMPPMVVTNYSGKINIRKSNHTIHFNSMGGVWDDADALYLWQVTKPSSDLQL